MGSRPIILRPSGLRMVDGIPSVTARSRSEASLRLCCLPNWVRLVGYRHRRILVSGDMPPVRPRLLPLTAYVVCSSNVSRRREESGLSDHVALARLIARAGGMARVRRNGPGLSVLVRGLAIGLARETGGETVSLLARSGIGLVQRRPCSLQLRACARSAHRRSPSQYVPSVLMLLAGRAYRRPCARWLAPPTSLLPWYMLIPRLGTTSGALLLMPLLGVVWARRARSWTPTHTLGLGRRNLSRGFSCGDSSSSRIRLGEVAVIRGGGRMFHSPSSPYLRLESSVLSLGDSCLSSLSCLSFGKDRRIRLVNFSCPPRDRLLGITWDSSLSPGEGCGWDSVMRPS